MARDGFQPTACIQSSHELAVLAGVPLDVDKGAAATSWVIAKAGPRDEILVAQPISSTQFKTVRIASDGREKGEYAVE